MATDAGPVTLATVDQLESRAAQWRAWSESSEAALQSLRNQADEHLAAAGGILVAHASNWQIPPELTDTVKKAESLSEHVASDDQAAAALKEREATANVFGRISVRYHEHQTEEDRAKASTELRALLIPIGRGAPPTTVAEADSERKSAADLEAQAEGIDSQAQAAEARVTAYQSELERRNEAIKAQGFDSLYETAVLQTSGPQAVDSPLVLKKGEQAYLSAPATPARMVSRTRYVGGSSGFSFPIGHTGIRYRVGSFHGQPIHEESLSKLDVARSFSVINGSPIWAAPSR